jgi:hypothetical protein
MRRPYLVGAAGTRVRPAHSGEGEARASSQASLGLRDGSRLSGGLPPFGQPSPACSHFGHKEANGGVSSPPLGPSEPSGGGLEATTEASLAETHPPFPQKIGVKLE